MLLRALPATAPAPATPARDPAAEQEAQHVYDVCSDAGVMGIEGALQRICRWKGKEPADMDDDEKARIKRGLAVIFRRWFGERELSPAGQVLVGTCVAGFGMYMGGKPIEPPKKLPPVEKPGAEGGESA